MQELGHVCADDCNCKRKAGYLTEITAAVPTGATTGKLEVITRSGTLNSNVLFRALA